MWSREHRNRRNHHDHTSTVMHPGDPAQWISVAHADGSFSTIRVGIEADDEVDVQIDSAERHHPHLHGDYT